MVSEHDGDAATAGPSMVDTAYDALLRAIVDARLSAGTPLSQNKLAALLGVSRTPVREALLRLEQGGLVERNSDAGFVVATITPQEVSEACDLLVLLDTFVYVRAAKALSSNDLDDLLVLAESLVNSAEAGDVAAWREADAKYHAVVMDAADNRLASRVLEETRRRVQRFWMGESHFDNRLRMCSQDHVSLARAMADADENTLEQTVRAHIERMRGNVLARLASAGPLLPGRDPLSVVEPAAPVAIEPR